MKLLEYYNSFLGGNWNRDFLKIPLTTDYTQQLRYRSVSKKKQFLKTHAKQSFMNTYYSISSFENLKELKKDKNNMNNQNRLHDRFFFDLDVDNEVISDFKEKIHQCFSDKHNSVKDAISQSRHLQCEVQDYLSDSELLDIALDETRQLHDELIEDGFKPYILFSGSKGFHVYVFFDFVKLENINQISELLVNRYEKELGIKHFDKSVNTNAVKSKSRIPFSKHGTSGFFTVPVDVMNQSKKEILEYAKNPFKNDDEVKSFDYDNLINHEVKQELIEFDKTISTHLNEINSKYTELNNKKKELRHVKNHLRKGVDFTVDAEKEIDFSDIDMRRLVGSVLTVVKSYTDYDTFHCPFHNDKNPSASAYKERFYCSSCSKSWNYYDFVKDYFGLSDTKDIINKVLELTS